MARLEIELSAKSKKTIWYYIVFLQSIVPLRFLGTKRIVEFYWGKGKPSIVDYNFRTQEVVSANDIIVGERKLTVL